MRPRRTVIATVALASVIGGAGTAAAGTAQPDPAAVSAVTTEDDCPEVVVLTARGSEENDIYPPSPSNGYSNGYEGETLHRFLDYTTQVHPGLFDDNVARVLAVDASKYPARFPVGEAGEDIDPLTLVTGVGQFGDSMVRGLPGGIDTVEEYEDSTGCKPDYVSLAYSQGVAVLGPVQHQLAEQGRLRGAVYMGNPFHRTPDLLTAGQSYPVHSYCVTDDFVCDFGPRSVYLALTDEEDAGAHADYFSAASEDPDAATAGDRRPADALANLLA